MWCSCLYTFDMLLVSAAEAVDYPEELATIKMRLFCERRAVAESAPHLVFGQGDLVKAILWPYRTLLKDHREAASRQQLHLMQNY